MVPYSSSPWMIRDRVDGRAREKNKDYSRSDFADPFRKVEVVKDGQVVAEQSAVAGRQVRLDRRAHFGRITNLIARRKPPERLKTRSSAAPAWCARPSGSQAMPTARWRSVGLRRPGESLGRSCSLTLLGRERCVRRPRKVWSFRSVADRHDPMSPRFMRFTSLPSPDRSEP